MSLRIYISSGLALLIFLLSSTFSEAKVLSSFVEVVAGCTSLSGNCVNVRSGAGTSFKVVKMARIGTLFEVSGAVLSQGRYWYRIKHDTGLVHPERVWGTWYIAADFVKIHPSLSTEYYSSPSRRTNKYILVDISSQKLYAYNGLLLFLSSSVSTGLKATPTPRGTFHVLKKKPSRYMQGPLPGISNQYYDLPGVPWNLYFTSQGAAIHGAYWHNNFGIKHSHGCVNLPVQTAKKLYDWTPAGIPVYVRE